MHWGTVTNQNLITLRCEIGNRTVLSGNDQEHIKMSIITLNELMISSQCALNYATKITVAAHAATLVCVPLT